LKYKYALEVIEMIPDMILDAAIVIGFTYWGACKVAVMQEHARSRKEVFESLGVLGLVAFTSLPLMLILWGKESIDNHPATALTLFAIWYLVLLAVALRDGARPIAGGE